ncbi:MAG: alpha/beta fold hydrolase, partial [Terriglobales bacterium]
MPHVLRRNLTANATIALTVFALASVLLAAPAPNAHPSFEVQIRGQGQPMILIPGLASSGATWNGTVAHFDRQYRCYVLTLAGFAGAPPDPAARGTLLATVREQLASYIRKQHLDRPVIVGHSLGGSIALDLAAHDPQLVGPVVIVDSLPFFAGAWFQAPNLA